MKEEEEEALTELEQELAIAKASAAAEEAAEAERKAEADLKAAMAATLKVRFRLVKGCACTMDIVNVPCMASMAQGVMWGT